MIEEFVRQGVLKFGDFQLSSGLRSPFYVDLRGVLGVPELFRFVVEKYLGVVSRLNFDVVMGVATGGIPYASVFGLLVEKTHRLCAS